MHVDRGGGQRCFAELVLHHIERHAARGRMRAEGVSQAVGACLAGRILPVGPSAARAENRFLIASSWATDSLPIWPSALTWSTS